MWERFYFNYNHKRLFKIWNSDDSWRNSTVSSEPKGPIQHRLGTKCLVEGLLTCGSVLFSGNTVKHNNSGYLYGLIVWKKDVLSAREHPSQKQNEIGAKINSETIDKILMWINMCWQEK